MILTDKLKFSATFAVLERIEAYLEMSNNKATNVMQFLRNWQNASRKEAEAELEGLTQVNDAVRSNMDKHISLLRMKDLINIGAIMTGKTVAEFQLIMDESEMGDDELNAFESEAEMLDNLESIVVPVPMQVNVLIFLTLNKAFMVKKNKA